MLKAYSLLTTLRMAAVPNAEALQRLETRAVGAEKMIQMLKAQIAQIRLASTGQGNASGEAAEVAALRAENEKLKQDIQEWKGKLVAAEKANGVEQVASGNAKQTKEVTPAPSAEEKKANPEQDKKKSEKKKKDKAPPPAKPSEAEEVHVGRLDMRVGLIRKATKHPDADSLYVEEVDVGEEKPRTVISGLVKFIPIEEMQNRKAILMCNLKPSKMRGIMSEAMVMCASTPDKVEILTPPEGSAPGDLVQVEGFERKPDAQLNPKKKIFEACAPDLKVNADKVATYKGVPWTVNGQKCHSTTLTDVQIK